MTKFTITDFKHRFPDDEACLAEIKELKYGRFTCPQCLRKDSLSPVRGRKSFACNCGYQVYPLAGTIFEKSTTSLWSWFYAMYLMIQTRTGISSKQLERELGVTYKTAWRMAHQIRKLMEQGGDLLAGEVEVDEAYIGGNNLKRHKDKRKPRKQGKHSAVLGMVERNGKSVLLRVPDAGKRTIHSRIAASVDEQAVIYHDDNPIYRKLGGKHEAVNHMQKEYVRGAVHTNNVENVWSHLKRGIHGVYRHVSSQHTQKYLNEFSWRYSHRALSSGPMFDALVARVSQRD